MNGNLKKNKKVRISLSVNADTYNALMELSEASGKPMSSFPSLILENSTKHFEAMTKAFLLAKKSPEEAISTIREQLELAMVDGARTLTDD